MKAEAARRSYAIEVLRDLFPGGVVTRAGDAPLLGKDRGFALAPLGRWPRLLVPLRPRGAAAAALRTYGGRMTRAASTAYAATSRALAVTGVAPLRSRVTVGSPGGHPVTGIDDHLSAMFGREVAVAIHLTPQRANRKPIVQVLAPGEARPIGFAKVGVDPLTNRLVRQEAIALADLAERRPTSLHAPTVVGHDRFAGLDVLGMRPLPTWRRGRSPQIEDVAAAAREVAALHGPHVLPLADSEYWQGLRKAVTELPETERAGELRRLVADIEARFGSHSLTFTASHGDWSPWNMWLTAEGLLVWDWERYCAQTPAGLDLLHFRMRDRFVRGAWSRDEAAHRLLAEAGEVAALAGSPDPPLLSAVLYLVHLAARYEADGQADAGAPMGRTEAWLLPVVAACLDDPTLTERT